MIKLTKIAIRIIERMGNLPLINILTRLGYNEDKLISLSILELQNILIRTLLGERGIKNIKIFINENVGEYTEIDEVKFLEYCEKNNEKETNHKH